MHGPRALYRPRGTSSKETKNTKTHKKGEKRRLRKKEEVQRPRDHNTFSLDFSLFLSYLPFPSFLCVCACACECCFSIIHIFFACSITSRTHKAWKSRIACRKKRISFFTFIVFWIVFFANSAYFIKQCAIWYFFIANKQRDALKGARSPH